MVEQKIEARKLTIHAIAFVVGNFARKSYILVCSTHCVQANLQALALNCFSVSVCESIILYLSYFRIPDSSDIE